MAPARAVSSHLPQGGPGWSAPPSQGIWVGQGCSLTKVALYTCDTFVSDRTP